MLHHGKHAPIPTILRPVAGINFVHKMEIYSFYIYKKKRPNISGIRVVI